MKHIVIIGGGFGGVNLAKNLGNKEGFKVTIVDRNNYNFFPPLYQLATGLLEVSSITYPFRKLLRKYKNIQFRMGEFQQIIPAEKKIIISSGELQYNIAVFASGAATNYFGMNNIKANALPMKTVNDAIELRNHFLETMEKASVETNEAERKKLLTVVIAGGGPTGVEVSGMLANLARKVIGPKDYGELAAYDNETHIYLVTGGDKLLEPMSEKSQQDTYKALHTMGVEIKLNRHVKDYINDVVSFEEDETIETKTLVWAAGVAPVILNGIPESSYGKGKRLLVDAFNKVHDLEDVYAIGDACLQTTDKNFKKGHPQLAQVAIQQGRNLAKNLISIHAGKAAKPFTYWDKGSMAIIGEHKAVADIPAPRLHLKGFIAWMAWLFVHLVSLIHHRNRVKTLYTWVSAFITRDNTLRLIIRPAKNTKA